MLSHRSLLSHAICTLGDILLFLSAVSNLYAQSPTAPTVSEAPESIDEIWQKASSKYDSELSIAHMLRRKLQLAKDERHFLTMLYYSVLAVYRYRTRDEGEDQVNILQ